MCTENSSEHELKNGVLHTKWLLERNLSPNEIRVGSHFLSMVKQNK